MLSRRAIIVRQGQWRLFQTVSRHRRLRPVFDKASTVAGQSFPKEQRGGSDLGHQMGPHGLSNSSSLSPWVPLPDAVARKALDMANAGSDDIHVDLGSGDGRVNFHALDGFRVKSSIGIEVDETLVAAAKERLMKRHPRPTNIDFFTADLLSSSSADFADPVAATARRGNINVWLDIIPHATIITFYFAKPIMIRSRLEAALTGKRCQIVSCGYEMPGWDASQQQVVLGTTIYLYDFGGDEASTFHGEDLLLSSSSHHSTIAAMQYEMNRHNQKNKFAGANVIDRTGHFPIRGFDPDSIHNNNDDDDNDADWDAVSDDGTEGISDKVEKTTAPTSKITTSKCSKKRKDDK